MDDFDIDVCVDVLAALRRRLLSITARVQDGMSVEGAHHKQFCLVEIAKLLGLDVSDVDQGIPE